MTILHVVHNSTPDTTGAAVRTRFLAETQARLGVRPVVLSSPFQPPAQLSQSHGVEYFGGVPYYRCYNGSDPARFMAARKPWWERAAKLAALPAFISRIREVARLERAEVIHAHNLFYCGLAAAAAGRSLGLPVVYEIRSLIEEGTEGIGPVVAGAYRALDMLACRLTTRVTVLCEGLRGEMVRRGLAESKIVVAGNGVDVEAHQPLPHRDRHLTELLGFPPDSFVLGYIGTLATYEGLDLLIGAAALLIRRQPRVRVLIVGEGNARPDLERQAGRLGLRRIVCFAGRVPHEQIDRYYSVVDLFVCPRQPSRLTDLVTPLKPLEIMAYGKPLLASDCGGHRELIRDGVNGLLFGGRDAGALACRVEELIADSKSLARLGARARQWVSLHRSWESQCGPVVELYRSLTGRRVLLVAPAPRGEVTGGVENGVGMILRSGLARRHQIRVWDRSRPGSLPRQLWGMARFAARLAVERPHVVHIKSSSGVNFIQSALYALLARLLGRRVLLQLHSGEFESWYVRHRLAGRAAIRWSLRVPSAILVLSEHWREVVARLVPGRLIHIVPNAVEILGPPPDRAGHNDGLRVLTIGTLGRHKGHFEILDAAGLLRNEPIRFLLAGPDKTSGRGDGSELRRRAAELRLEGSVEFRGPVGPAEKSDLLAQADLFLLPSRAEGMPNAVLEAMAAGLPVVATPVGSLPEMLDGEGARFVPVGDPAALAEALVELLRDPGRRDAMGRWNYKRAAVKYSFSGVERLLDALYREPEVEQ